MRTTEIAVGGPAHSIAEIADEEDADLIVCVVLGRGADDDKVDHWLRQAAPV